MFSAIVLALFSTGAAADSEPFAGRLTGDWGGSRASLRDHGITFDLDSSNYFQGLLQGSGDKSFESGGRLDAYLNFDTGKLGLWSGGLIRTHTEYFFGSLEPNLGGTVAPNNLGVKLPMSGPETLQMTAINLVQRLNERVNLIAGKINTVDLIATDPFFGGGGATRFMNLAFAAPPNGLLPPVIFGAITTMKTAPLDWTFMAYDPEDRTSDYLPEDLFHTGVNVSASAKRNFLIGGRSSSLAVTGIYSTADAVNLGEVLLPPELSTGQKSDSWHASLQFAHFLKESTARAGDGWGVFVKVGGSDGNPNPYQGFITGGFGGRGILAARPTDTFGIGYFYYDLSDDLQSAIDPLADFDDEQGIEAYYNFEVAPGLLMAADLQYVDPATGASDRAFIGGLRVLLRL